MTKGFYSIMLAQFLSSLADNALLIAAIALLATLNEPEWMTPLLKLFFVVSYVLFAAWVGIFADTMPKGRVMFITNAVKTLGCCIMLFGTHPLLAYGIVGLGAAAYSPAKYGILTELLPPEKLVKANGWIEGLTVASIILGTGLGGFLISPMIDHFVRQEHLLGVHNAAQAAIAVMILVYAAAAAVNLLIPDTGARYPKQDFRPVHTLVNFGKSCALLWKDKLGQISLSVTTLFWGAGATLQFLVLAWADTALGLDLSKAAILQGVVAIGIAIGAVLAATFVSLRKSIDVLPIGVAMGFSVAIMSFFKGSWIPGGFDFIGIHFSYAVIVACIMLVVVGMMAGFFVVPMNALLQHRGHVLMSAGRSIAVQNFNENSSILVMLALYSLLIKSGLGTVTIMVLFGSFVGCSMLAVILKHRHNQSQEDSLHLIGEEKRH
ncbi:lysophospholipid transporter LplT [uncultured Parasutterella sp.]|uniref:lysophospholipid transporter LplT n=1 Tax=uncultured Parasutterella sp. TaxID=1263098 RepID=UPI0025B70C31|nr:lysophospholipid transporter LplT [uncultured Parasutterella sp.]